MKLVVDASVVVPCFVPEHFSPAARNWLDKADMLLAPELLSLECGNALWRKARLGEITLREAKRALRQVVSGFIELRPSTPLACAALELGAELDHPVYDCAYLALAKAEAAAFLTADRKLVEVVLARRPALQAHWVADEIPRAP